MIRAVIQPLGTHELEDMLKGRSAGGLNNGISIIREGDPGIVHKFLASPAPQAALVTAKALGVYLRPDPITPGGVALLLRGPGAIEAKAFGM
ncbi:MAG: hypothetical protein ACLPX1_00935 [Steroidobacteraceae bacterium]